MQKLTDLLNSLPKKLAEVIKNIKTKKANVVPTPAVPQSTTQEVYSSPNPQVNTPSVTPANTHNVVAMPMLFSNTFFSNKQNKKKVGIIAVSILLLFILFAVISKFMPKNLPNLLSPSPTPTPTPVVIATPPPTKYATDAGILKIESDIQALDMELGAVELDETNLRPRPLDYNINFK